MSGQDFHLFDNEIHILEGSNDTELRGPIDNNYTSKILHNIDL